MKFPLAIWTHLQKFQKTHFNTKTIDHIWFYECWLIHWLMDKTGFNIMYLLLGWTACEEDTLLWIRLCSLERTQWPLEWPHTEDTLLKLSFASLKPSLLCGNRIHFAQASSLTARANPSQKLLHSSHFILCSSQLCSDMKCWDKSSFARVNSPNCSNELEVNSNPFQDSLPNFSQDAKLNPNGIKTLEPRTMAYK